MSENRTDAHTPKNSTATLNQADSDCEQSVTEAPFAPSSSGEYIQLLESRIRQLEQSVRQLQESASLNHEPSDPEQDIFSDIDNASVQEPQSTLAPEAADVKQQPIVAEIFMASYLGFRHRLEGDVYAIETDPHEHDGTPNDDIRIRVRELAQAEAIDYILTNRAARRVDPSSLWAIRINSPAILRALHEIDPSMPMDGCPLVFHSPFLELIESYNPMKLLLEEVQSKADGAEEEDQQELVSHLSCYMQLIGADILPIYHRLKQNKPDTDVSFWELYYLFGDEDELYCPATTDSSSRHQQLWRPVPRSRLQCYASLKEDVDYTIEITCYHLDFDGHSYVAVTSIFVISFFRGQRLVTSLPIYPLRFVPNARQILKEAQAAGLKFTEAIREKQMTYHGWALRSQEDKNNDRGFVSSNVIVDCAEAFKVQPHWRPVPGDVTEPTEETWAKRDKAISMWWKDPSSGRLAETLQSEWHNFGYFPQKYLQKHAFYLRYWTRLTADSSGDGQEQQLQEEDLSLLPRWLVAYSLQDRMFLMLETLHLKRLEDTGDPFKDLAITPGHKKIIWSLVHSHFEKRKMEQTHSFYDISQDIIHNKGRGLVVLLHGVPGVGKTSTAEAVAQKWKKPLLAITCGDLGLEAADVEKSLKDIFRLAQLWECVLLLDEADVFISQRRPSDLQRNSFSAVGNMDEAFKSRIHMSLYYPPLNREQTKKIWAMNLARLESIEKERHRATGQPKLSIAAADIMKYAMEHFTETSKMDKAWNGRQIRNAFLTAAALARYDQHSAKGKLHDGSTYDITVKHFRIVADASWGFDEYLHETKGKSDAQLARYMGARSDHFTSGTPVQSPPAVSERASAYPPHTYGYQAPSTHESPYAEQQHEVGGRDSVVPSGRLPYTSFDSTPRTEPQYTMRSQARRTSPFKPYPDRHESHDSLKYGRHLDSAEEYPMSSRPRTPQPPQLIHSDEQIDGPLATGTLRRNIAGGRNESPNYLDDEYCL
ncbi:hypothetical protein BDW72DRAFT_196176 [Aspergillus terricola var. indicus]